MTSVSRSLVVSMTRFAACAVTITVLSGCSSTDPSGGSNPSERSNEGTATTTMNTSDPSGSGSESGAGLTDPTFEEVTNASDYSQTPPSMVQSPSAGDVEELADRGFSRLDAEAFAVGFAQIQSDTREDRDQVGFVGDVLAKQAPQSLRDYLLQDYEIQRQGGSERHYDPDEQVWLRSAVEGSDDAPSKVSVEIAGVLVSKPLSLRFTNNSRVDLVLEGDAWRVIGYAWLATGTNIKDGASPNFDQLLQGRGWRRLS